MAIKTILLILIWFPYGIADNKLQFIAPGKSFCSIFSMLEKTIIPGVGTSIATARYTLKGLPIRV